MKKSILIITLGLAIAFAKAQVSTTTDPGTTTTAPSSTTTTAPTTTTTTTPATTVKSTTTTPATTVRTTTTTAPTMTTTPTSTTTTPATTVKTTTTTTPTTTTTTTTTPRTATTTVPNNKTVIKTTELIKAITDNITKDFPGYKINQAFKIENKMKATTNYEVVVEKGASKENLYYDGEGKFLRKEIPGPTTTVKPTQTNPSPKTTTINKTETPKK